jgi:hypothetical protein
MQEVPAKGYKHKPDTQTAKPRLGLSILYLCGKIRRRASEKLVRLV